MPSCPDEGTIQGFVENALAPGALGEIEHHVADCTDCRQLVAALRSDTELKMTAPTARGPGGGPMPESTPNAIGRYEIIELIGAGGMGLVFEAKDPGLQRRVAIKLLRGTSHDDAGSRLIREARAMAEVQHPNVVGVFDVGMHGDDEVYIAMELVRGGTLRRWLLAESRSQREIIDVYLEAGRGLAAAHAVKLVHRDFKPDNVLVGSDGRVRVTDFGLARHHGRAHTGPPDRQATPAASLRLTATGAVNGTPGYISPEQYAHETFDARSDQFSFCVSLWEALCGQRPFGGGDADEIERSVVSGKLREPATPLPRALRRVLDRGLALDPAERWPSMTALLAELARTRPRSKRWPIAIAATALVIGGLVALVVVLAMRGPAPAEFIDDPDRLGAETVEVSQLLMSGDRAGGSKRADEIVAQYAAEGGANHAAALNLRGFAHYYNGELAQAETVLVKAVSLAEGANARRVKAIAIGQLVHTLEDLGKLEDAKRWSGMVVASARSPTDTDTQLALALDAEAHREWKAGQHAVAIAKYSRGAAIWASIGNLSGWAANRTMLARNLGNVLQYDAACALTAGTFTTLAVVPHTRDLEERAVQAALANGGAICEMGRERVAESIGYAERAVALITEAHGDRSPQLETPLIHLGRAYANVGDRAASDAAFERALSLSVTDRERIQTLGIMAVAAFEAEQFDVSVERAERMVALADKTLPDNHPERVSAKVMLAKLLLKANQRDRARTLAEELLVIYQTVDDPLMLADTWFLLARTVTDPKRARTFAEQARAAYQAAGSVRAPHLADVDKFLATH